MSAAGFSRRSAYAVAIRHWLTGSFDRHILTGRRIQRAITAAGSSPRLLTSQHRGVLLARAGHDQAGRPFAVAASAVARPRQPLQQLQQCLGSRSCCCGTPGGISPRRNDACSRILFGGPAGTRRRDSTSSRRSCLRFCSGRRFATAFTLCCPLWPSPIALFCFANNFAQGAAGQAARGALCLESGRRPPPCFSPFACPLRWPLPGVTASSPAMAAELSHHACAAAIVSERLMPLRILGPGMD